MKTRKDVVLLKNGLVLVGAPEENGTHKQLAKIAKTLKLEIANETGYMIEDAQGKAKPTCILQFPNNLNFTMEIYWGQIIEIGKIPYLTDPLE